jgi:hypothetical protein
VSVAGRFVGLRVVGRRSVLTVRATGGYDREVTLAARPNLGLARNLTGGFRRLAWVRIDTTSTPMRCEVSGIARRPHRCRIPLAAALALAAADVPTLVRLHPLEV